jgi:hypothetical protein
MGGSGILLGVLTFAFLFIIFGMNYISLVRSKAPFANRKEGFADVKAGGEAKPAKSAIENQVRLVMDGLAVPEICPLYTTIRTNMVQNYTAGPQALSIADANKKVEANLALKIPGGALPCPLFTYPKAGSTDLDWLAFVQGIPSDFGARVVFMAIYAKDYLGSTEQTLKDALSGKGKVPNVDPAEAFTVCTPDVADTRRAEKANKVKAQEAAQCQLPEDMKPEDLEAAIIDLLKTLVAQKTSVLLAKQIDPNLDILPLIKDALASAKYINEKSQQAQSGTLAMDAPIQASTFNSPVIASSFS